ncbi:hypothetical protein G4V62_15645 [Bacillaceae bacterium SIJ1]|uniref:hypothetical protein n=1 Tax=Litoribacterium kuwaitense TaxID=1398745 RepID=UPI0013EA4ADA|nr:hypothetical protein [Litoribacterium kuwaitense]NGP46306.1 hypothetical protein [Litoribacterium kuwaitense]
MIITVVDFSQYVAHTALLLTAQDVVTGGLLFIGVQWIAFFYVSASLVQSWHGREQTAEPR